MQVTSKCSLLFHSSAAQLSGAETFTLGRTAPGEYKQVPDWVLENPYFKSALADGRVTLVEVKSAPTMTMPSNDPKEVEKLKMVLQPAVTGNEGGIVAPANAPAAIVPVPAPPVAPPPGAPPLAGARVRKNMVSARQS
jgi:hypothetical protein